MKRSFSVHRTPGSQEPDRSARSFHPSGCLAVLGSLAVLMSAACASAQVITIDTHGNATTGSSGTVDRRFQQITPTHVPLQQTPLDTKTRLDLIRFLEADQGFAMRPIPRGHKGLTLLANGEMEPAGEPYLNMVTTNGLSAKPGDRLVLSDVKFEKSKIIFEINGGPDAKHRFLRHVQIGMDPNMTNPVVQGDDQGPAGARLTLTFQHGIPQMTGKEVEALLAPLISFEVKTPIQAFTDTLPPRLKQAILDHHVLVGMSTDMVLYALGHPANKIREMDGQMPIEIWVYGKPPEDVDFVRINGNRVIRVEVAAVGKPVEIFTHDEVDGLMRTDGTPVAPAAGTRTVQMGDVERNPDTQAPAAPPSLRQPGETLPKDSSSDTRVGVMKPVQFPKQKTDDDSSAASDGQAPAKPAGQTTADSKASGTAQPDTSQPPATKPATEGSQPQ